MGKKHALFLHLPPQQVRPGEHRVVTDFFVALLMLMGATLLGSVLYHLELANSSIMMVYLLAVLLVAVITSHLVYSLAASVASLFLFNFFFVQPRFSLNAYEPGYPVSFFVMFLTAIIAGTLANRLKRTAYQAERNAFHAQIISETDRMLAKAESREDILRICAEQCAKLLEGGVVLYEAADGTAVRYCSVPEEDSPFGDESLTITEELMHGRPENLCFPIHIQEKLYAVLQVVRHDPPPDPTTQNTLTSLLGECALALENEQNAREKQEAAILAENERLRANLLRSISHDLRTPLMSITGNAEALLDDGNRYSEQTRHQLCTDIYEDSLWLTDLVENLLASTKLEGGDAKLRLSPELVEDLFEEALAHIHADSDHNIRVDPGEEMIMVRVDSRLMIQVLVNLVGNALKYTPPGSTICLSAKKENNIAVISVADDGNGIPAWEHDRIFDMFFVGENAASAGRKGLGLGLSLCKTIVNTHGGEIWVEDNSPHGAVFSFTLPAEEVTEYGQM